MQKLDLAKKYKAYYTAKPIPEIVQIEKVRFVSITGKGDPSDVVFAGRVQALYTVAYSIKFVCKARGEDFIVPKLEALWWFDNEKYDVLTIEEAPAIIPRSEWEYRLLLRMPDFVSDKDIASAVTTAAAKKALAAIKEVTAFTLEEGNVVQILHIGPFDKEPETLKVLGEFMKTNRLQHNGLHHEIYLSDFRKTAPAKLKTILREPVK